MNICVRRYEYTDDGDGDGGDAAETSETINMHGINGMVMNSVNSLSQPSGFPFRRWGDIGFSSLFSLLSARESRIECIN